MWQIKRCVAPHFYKNAPRTLPQRFRLLLSARLLFGVVFSLVLMAQGIVQARHYGVVQTSAFQTDSVHQVLCLSAPDQASLLIDSQSGVPQSPQNNSHHNDCAFCPACSNGVGFAPEALVYQNPRAALLLQARPIILIHAIAALSRLAARPREPPMRAFQPA